jgi:hypothetical protein
MPVTIDPAVSDFVTKVSAGAAGLADSVAALLLRLAFRVSCLERTAAQQAQKLERLTKQPKPAPVTPLVPLMTGIDTATGAAVRVMPKRSRGRPPGSRDTYKRPPRGRHHDLQVEVSNHHLSDSGWDDLSVG